MQKKSFFFLIATIFLSGYFFFQGIQPAHAADPKPTIKDNAFRARYVSQSIPDPIVIQAGESKTVDIKFKNVGTATWRSSGARYISAYTMEPRYRVSQFLQARQSNPISGSVAPGETATLRLTLRAPEQPGEYTEEFYLAAENYSWMDGGYFYLKIQVVPKTNIEPAQQDSEKPAENEQKHEDEPMAKVIGQTKKRVSVTGGEEISVKFILQNISGQEWNGYRLLGREQSGVNIADDSWNSISEVMKREDIVTAGEVIKPSIRFRAPAKAGTYRAEFFLDETHGESAVVDITVTQDASKNYRPAHGGQSAEIEKTKQELPRLNEEPRIRVGLVGEGKSAQFVSYEDDYLLLVDGKEEGILPKKKVAIILFDNGTYRVRGAGFDINTKGIVRLEPKSNPHAVIQVMNGLKDRSIAWVGPSEFKNYRGALEYRQGEKDKDLYIVNDLLLEDYVAGIAETGHGVHEEAVKANLVAARTYAYLSKGKYPFFDVLGSTYDQLYLGADVAKYLANVPKAAEATRGKMVTYNDEIVTTPYFGNSNGTTRSWSSVWGGSNKPWLVPVVAAYDKGRAQFGHGVGMSQRDAALRAKNDGWNYEQILTHYYTGTELSLIYK